MMLPSWLWFGVGVFFERVVEVTVWMVALAFWGAPLRGMLEGSEGAGGVVGGVDGGAVEDDGAGEVVDAG